MSPSTPDALLIDDVQLLSPGRPLQRGAALRIEGGRIAWTGPRAQAAPAARRLDGRGVLCLPGFVNTHNHTPLMIVRGMVEDLGFAPAYTPGIPQGHWLSDEETFLLARLGQMELLMAGCTTVVDYYRSPDALARAALETGLRAFIGGRVMDADSAALAEGRFERDAALGERTLRDGVDLIARWDGADGGRIRAVHAPHAPDTCSRGLLQEIARLAAADGRPVHTHLAQSPLEVDHVRARDGISPVQLLDDLGLLNPALFAAHGIFVDEADIARAGQAGLHLCHAPIGNATFGAFAPVLALRQAGVKVTLCTDTKSADMFETMRMAIVAARARAQAFVLDAATVFGWATAGGADALGLPDLGRLEAGCRADVVLLDPEAPNLLPVVDGVGIVVHAGSAANVRHVFRDGEHLVADGRPTRLDAQAVRREAQAVADRLWARARGG
ncbi:MAG: amidohydrolase family protein [Burkholderiaceae bacterium]|nr:amidohydrolase family protein [Burkholderiaceae bacterium]